LNKGGNKMIYGYARCSTNETKQDINRQVRELKQGGAIDETIYLEYQSGTKADRVELNKLLNLIKSGDTILATEVSRITRSTKQLCEIIELAKDKHIKLVLGSFIVDCTKELDPMTEGMLKMMGVFSELERNMISQRVKSGMENAKAKGKIVGRPSTTVDDIPAIFYKHYPKYKSGEINKKEFSRLCSLSYPTIYKYLGIVENNKK
jgi:DNA invertase Pin-like site-specific DNA recombinase